MIKKIFTLLCLCTLCIGSAWGDEVTYTFTSKSWGAQIGGTVANWSSGKDGGQLTSGQGIQVTKTGTGANGTSDISYSNISKVTVHYCTNKSDGAGNIEVKVGDEVIGTNNITKSGGTTIRDLVFTPSSSKTGKVKITVNCTTNSIYIHSVTITYTAGPVRTLQSIYITGQASKKKYYVGDAFNTSGLKVYGIYDEGEDEEISENDITWSINPETFVNTSATSVKVIATALGKTSDEFVVNGLTVSEPDVYTLVTSTDQLVAGAHYMIGGAKDEVVDEDGNNAYFMNTTANTNNRQATKTLVSDDNKINAVSGLLTLTLGGSKGAWTFNTDNYEGNDGYLNATNTTGSNYLQVKNENDVYDKFTISFGEGGNAIITCTGKSSRNLMRFNSGNTPPIFACYTSGQNEIYLYKKEGISTQPATMTSTGYATFSLDGALDLSNLPEGLTAYKATTISDNKIKMVAVKTAVAANTGLFLKGKAGVQYEIPVAESGEDLEDNLLEATTGEKLAAENYVYVINSGAFQPLGKETFVSKGKAYIPASKIPALGKLEISFEDPTGINNVANVKTADSKMYNLQGVQVSKNYNGIVIMNGKKYLNK